MASWIYEDRGTPEDALLIGAIKVSPDPPAPGRDLVVQVRGDLQKLLDDEAYVEITMKLGLIKLLQKRNTLKEFFAEWGASVPSETGPFTLEFSKALPREIPSATFTIRLDAYTGGEEDVFCLEFKVNFKTS
ncbi:ML domain-containing protein [Streptomyces sp. R-07]|uniref:ML domain-containing protein n=1 Tax=unclassified Streptomyces TaxID=2593676 RepID=UPI00343859FF